jgi:hypothetical protein
MKTPCWLAPLALSLWLTARTEQARADPIVSDVLFERIRGNFKPIDHPVGFNISEKDENGTPREFRVPALTIDFVEGGKISDRFHFNAFTVTVTSDEEEPLPDRRGMPIMSEKFDLLSFIFASDTNPTPQGGRSDSYGIGVGKPAQVNQFLIEPAMENQAERAPIKIDPTRFNVMEKGGGISDYVDLGRVTGYFLSSDNQADYNPNLHVDARIPEQGGGLMTYDLIFNSAVSEPATIATSTVTDFS